MYSDSKNVPTLLPISTRNLPFYSLLHCFGVPIRPYGPFTVPWVLSSEPNLHIIDTISKWKVQQ